MVPGVIICIAPGSMDASIIRLLAEKGITVIGGEVEPQTPSTQGFESWVSAVQAQQARKGHGEKARPPWIRKATRRAPRKL
jgi:hypothetical protein